MFACLYGSSARLAELADQFSPLVEKAGEGVVVFSISGLESLFGDAYQIASEIARRGAAMGVMASLAIAANKPAAMMAARHLPGVTIIPPGRESGVLADIPVAALPADPDLLLTLHRWGIRTLDDLAALPEIGIAERLGEAGLRLHRLALGKSVDLLHLTPPAPDYTARHEFEYPIELLEPLLFIIFAQLHDLTDQLLRNGQAAIRVTVTLSLEGGAEFVRSLDLPVAMRDPKALLKQLQISLEAKPPQAPILAAQVMLDPAHPRAAQHGLFHPEAPEPEKLETLLARLRALVGVDHAGTPEILNSHRPDAWRLRPCIFEAGEPAAATSRPLHLALRRFRPPLTARVVMERNLPRRVVSERVSGAVIQTAGPWRTSGDWWAETAWLRDEWDVVLESGGVYRIYLAGDCWFLEGCYD